MRNKIHHEGNHSDIKSPSNKGDEVELKCLLCFRTFMQAECPEFVPEKAVGRRSHECHGREHRNERTGRYVEKERLQIQEPETDKRVQRSHRPEFGELIERGSNLP